MLQNNRGGALPLVLIIIVVLTLLGTALWQYSMADVRQVTREESRMQAFYYARSGAEITAAGIRDGQLSLTGDELESSDIFFSDGDGDEYLSDNVDVKINKSNENILIESTGTVNDVSKTVNLELSGPDDTIEYWSD